MSATYDTSTPNMVYSIASNTNGTPNSIWTTSTSGININLSPLTNTWYTDSTFDFNQSKNLKVAGDAEFEGDVKIKGKSIKDSLEKIEERLAIIHRNIELEEKWDELRDLARKYKELEQDILEKEKIMELLKV